MDSTTLRLKQESIPRLVIKMAIPATLGMLATALYTLVDRLFISIMIDKPTGNNFALGAMTVVNPYTLVALAFLLLLSTGTTTLISIYLGRGEQKKAEHVLGNTFLLLTLGGLILGCVGLIFEQKILLSLGASENTYLYAKDYFTVVCSGVVFLSLSFGLASAIRGEGNAKLSMIIMGIGAGLNVVLDPLFIGVFHLGIKGAALATIISQAISASIAIYYYFSGKSILKFRLQNLLPNREIITRALYIGMAQFILQLATSLVSVAYNYVLKVSGESVSKNMGDAALAAYGITNMITQLFVMCVYGINDGVQPVYGYNYGAKEYTRVAQTLKWATICATVVLTVGFLLCMLIPEVLVSMFNASLQIEQIAIPALRIQVIFWPIIALSVVTSGYFQSIGKPILSLSVALCRQAVFLLPLLFAFSSLWAITGIWWASPVSDVLATLLAAVLLVKYRQILARVSPE